ncbi:MAG: S-layer homology domain-containing protein [Candidatus Aminicenantia bacterium]
MARRLLNFAIFIFLISCITPVKEVYIIEKFPEEAILDLQPQERKSSTEIWKLIEEGKAKRAYLKLKKMDQNSFFTSLTTGYALLLKGELEQSELWFKKALSIKKESSSPHVGLAQIYEKKGDFKNAYAEWKTADTLNPQNVNVRLRVEKLKTTNTEKFLQKAEEHLSSNDMENAIKAFEEALFYSPELTPTRLKLTEILEKIGRELECIPHLEIASKEQPANLTIKKKLGLLYLKSENYERAYEIFRELSQIDPKDNELKGLLVRAENGIISLRLPPFWKDIPNKKAITRADLAALIAVKFKKFFKDIYIKPPIITDISNHWAQNFILQITSLEIMDVYPNHAFYPENPISRQDLAVAIYRLTDILERLGKNIFRKIEYKRKEIKDIPLEHMLRGTIEKVVFYGLMDTEEGGNFRPGDFVSGGEGLATISFVYEIADKS